MVNPGSSPARPGGGAAFDADHAAFLRREWISCAVAARDAGNRPSLAKAVAVRLCDDLNTVEVFVDGERAAGVLRDLRAGSPIALVCSEPASHRSIQVKGERAEVLPVGPGDAEFVAARFEAVATHVVALSYPHDGIRAYFHYAPEHLAKITFVAGGAFGQTPGPGAGAPLGRP